MILRVPYVVYETATGRVLRYGSAPSENAANAQARTGESILLEAGKDELQWLVNGVLSAKGPADYTVSDDEVSLPATVTFTFGTAGVLFRTFPTPFLAWLIPEDGTHDEVYSEVGTYHYVITGQLGRLTALKTVLVS